VFERSVGPRGTIDHHTAERIGLGAVATVIARLVYVGEIHKQPSLLVEGDASPTRIANSYFEE
jgi:hypothetical protein